MRTATPLSLAVLAALLPLVAGSQVFHVSPRGRDGNDGSALRPVASLEAARSLLRRYKDAHGLPDGGLRVTLHGGTYDLGRGLRLEAADAGREGAPVTWAAAPGEAVHVTGGRTLRPSAFRQVTDPATLARLHPDARGKVWRADLAGLGIRDYGRHRQYGHSLPVVPAPLELFIDGRPLTLARYPNQGAIAIGKVLDAGAVPRTGDKSDRGAVFHFTDPRHKTWAGLPDVWIQGTLNYGFADDFNPVAAIDTLAGTVRLGKPHLYGVASGKPFQAYVAYNILGELDTPGEWYLDRADGHLYVWPATDIARSRIQVSLLEEPVISLHGTAHLRLEGITIEAGRGIGIHIEDSRHTLVAGCTVRNTGTAGIFMGQGAEALDEKMSVDDYEGRTVSGQIGAYQNHFYRHTSWNRKAGEYNRILSSDVYNTGCGGIVLSGGDKRSLSPGHSSVENCRIHDFNRRNKFTWAGIRVDGCGNRVAHNEIYNGDFHGIFVFGNDHVFEYNHVHDMTLNSNDTSPWYMGRNPSDRGNIVRYNFFDNCGNADRMNMGIYCDDSSADVYVYGNVFNDMKTDHGVLFSNSGWHLVMRNNIVVNPIAATAEISAHYYTWYAGHGADMFGEKGLLRRRLTEDVDFRSPPYATRYPALLPYLDPIVDGKEWQGMRARGNLLEGNLIVGGPANPVSRLGGPLAQIDSRNNWQTTEDPGFVDMAKKDFRLRPDSKAFQKIQGFEPVPFEKMGTYKDAYRR